MRQPNSLQSSAKAPAHEASASSSPSSTTPRSFALVCISRFLAFPLPVACFFSLPTLMML